MSPSTQDDALIVSLSANPATSRVLITLTPPTSPADTYSGTSENGGTQGQRAPLDICCVIDVSGSMAASADIRGNSELGIPPEKTGLTILDIVKHSLRTIVAAMQKDDRIAVVTFTDYAAIICNLTCMDDASKVKLLNDIEQLVPLDCTNLWEGLKTGMDLLLDRNAHLTSPVKRENRNTTLFLLTDGIPNIIPPRGHIAELTSYLAERSPSGVQSFSINTFGFGYQVDTPLLVEIANIGGGGYNFIPDVGMVGTVFVNAVASAYAVYAQHVKVECQLSSTDGGNQRNFEIEVKGQLQSTKMTSGIQFDAGDVLYGQQKNHVLQFSPSLPHSLRVFAMYRPVSSSSVARISTAELSYPLECTKEERAEIEYHAAASTLASILLTTTRKGRRTSATALQDLHSRLSYDADLSAHPEAAALARDVGGEAARCVSSDAEFDRWGKHYASSFGMAHRRQHCQSFKDKSLQRYSSSPVFQSEKARLEKAWHLVPSPTSPSQSSSPTHYQNNKLPEGGNTANVWSPMSEKTTQDPSNSSQKTMSSFSTLSSMSSQRPSLSPEYPGMLSQFAQYAPTQQLPQPSQQSSLSRSKSVIGHRKQQRQSLTNSGQNTPSSPSPPGQPERPKASESITPTAANDLTEIWALDDFELVPSPCSPMSPGQPERPMTSGFITPTAANDLAAIRAIDDFEFVSSSPCSPMSPFYNVDGPCFTGGCLVRMPMDVNPVRVDELRRGMTVDTLGGPKKVAAVLRTNIDVGQMLLCRLGGLEITPWHPVRPCDSPPREGDDGTMWVFPGNLVKPALVPCDAVYSVLLEREDGLGSSDLAHSISVSGVWCVTLGHGVLKTPGNDIRAHAFLGDYDKVVNEMSHLDGFFEEGGVARCTGVRRGPDGTICGFARETIVRRGILPDTLVGMVYT